MHITGRFEGAYLTTDGNVMLTFLSKDKNKAFEEIDAIKDFEKLTIDAVKYVEKKSTQANAYLWQLCDKIAKHPHINLTKDDIYLMHIRDYGVFVDVKIDANALDMLKRQYRYVDILDEDEYVGFYGEPIKMLTARCYYGSSTYSKAELSHLIDGVVETAKELGIDTWTDDEIQQALAVWKGAKADGNRY